MGEMKGAPTVEKLPVAMMPAARTLVAAAAAEEMEKRAVLQWRQQPP